MAITDHGMVSGIVKFNRACINNGIKPLLGCEFYTVSDASDRSSSDRNHLTIIAKTQEGYENLMKLVTASWKHGFYYKPRIDSKMLLDHNKGLIVMSGCYSGSLCHAFREENFDKARKIASNFSRVFDGDYYLEMQPLELTYEYNKFVQELSRDLSIKMVMTNDTHFVRKGQDRLQRILHLVRGTDETKSSTIDTLYPLDSKELDEVLSRFPGINWVEAVNSTFEIANKANVEIPKTPMVKYPEGENSNAILSERCYLSEKWRRLKDDPVYQKRLKYELEIVIKKDFSSYFVLINDICKYMHKNEILVGPGRGSSGGSLICFLLDIIQMDPIKYDLMFERFLDLNRMDYPDIDMDIQPSRIPEVKKYVKEIFGEDRVASIATFSEYRGKNIIDDLGRIYKIPHADTNLFKSRIIQYSDADARYSFGIEDTIAKFPEVQRVVENHPELKVAVEMEGQFRHMGQHAAGIVVSGQPLYKSSAVYLNRIGEDLISWDLKDFEELNLLKIDLLKLQTLDILKKILDLIGWKPRDLYNLPLDDPKVLQAFKDLDMLGIFQFDGYSAYWVLSQVDIKSIDDLAHVNALGRPGPITSRAAHRFIKAQRGIKEGNEIPELEKFTWNTGGEVIYQEQVMSIVRELAGFSWEDASKIRKIIAKSLGVEGFNKFGKQFVEGCSKNNIDPEISQTIWDRLSVFGCLAGNTRIYIDKVWSKKVEKRNFKTIKQIYEDQGRGIVHEIPTINIKTGKVFLKKPISIVYSGIKSTYYMRTLRSGRSRTRVIRCTKDHQFLVSDGFWKSLKEIKTGDKVYASKRSYSSFNYQWYSGIVNTKNINKRFCANGEVWNKGLAKSDERVKKYVMKSIASRCKSGVFNNWGYGECSVALDGHFCQSSFELEFEDWMIKNNIPHKSHAHILNSARISDYQIGDCYIELDGMDPPRNKEFWDEKYSNGERYIILYPGDDFGGILKLVDPIIPENCNGGYEEVYEIKYAGDEETYDVIMEPDTPFFVADGFLVHNSWAFNRSHAFVYAALGFYCMFFKLYFPKEFYFANIFYADSEEKLERLLLKFSEHGKVFLPNINKSGVGWRYENGNIYAGLDYLKGVGGKTAESIVKNAPYKDWDDLVAKNGKRIVRKNVLELLKANGAFEDRELVSKAFELFKKYSDGCDKVKDIGWETIRKNREVKLVCYIKNRTLYNQKQEDEIRGITKKYKSDNLDFMVVSLEDDTGLVKAKVNPWIFPRYRDVLMNSKESEIFGVMGKQPFEQRTIWITDIVRLETLDESTDD